MARRGLWVAAPVALRLACTAFIRRGLKCRFDRAGVERAVERGFDHDPGTARGRVKVLPFERAELARARVAGRLLSACAFRWLAAAWPLGFAKAVEEERQRPKLRPRVQTMDRRSFIGGWWPLFDGPWSGPIHNALISARKRYLGG